MIFISKEKKGSMCTVLAYPVSELDLVMSSLNLNKRYLVKTPNGTKYTANPNSAQKIIKFAEIYSSWVVIVVPKHVIDILYMIINCQRNPVFSFGDTFLVFEANSKKVCIHHDMIMFKECNESGFPSNQSGVVQIPIERLKLLTFKFFVNA